MRILGERMRRPPVASGTITETMLQPHLRKRSGGGRSIASTATERIDATTARTIAHYTSATSQVIAVPAYGNAHAALNAATAVIVSPDVTTTSPWTYTAPTDQTVDVEVIITGSAATGIVGITAAIRVAGDDVAVHHRASDPDQRFVDRVSLASGQAMTVELRGVNTGVAGNLTAASVSIRITDVG